LGWNKDSLSSGQEVLIGTQNFDRKIFKGLSPSTTPLTAQNMQPEKRSFVNTKMRL
jgi:hypothetical protein